jgi:hypothetical protein
VVVVIRCTAKILKLLGVRPSSLVAVEPDDDDWYVNLLWFERRKCLLLLHAGTTFSVFVPDVRKADLDLRGPFLVDAIVSALDAEGLPHDVLGDLDGQSARVATTASRRVLGVMNDVAVHIDYALDRYGSVLDVDVITLNRGLQRTLHGRGRDYATPLQLVAERALGPRGS